MGNDFLDSYDVSINYRTKEVTLQSLDFSLLFSIYEHLAPCVCKVKTARAITLLPDQEAIVPVEYKLLPNDRSFIFNSDHTVVHYAVVIAKTPKVVLVKNTTGGIVKIPKRCPIGRIEESYDSGFLACSWTSALTALAAGASLATSRTPQVARDADPTIATGRYTQSLLVNSKFAIDSSTLSIISNHHA